jgi:acylphosphatase
MRRRLRRRRNSKAGRLKAGRLPCFPHVGLLLSSAVRLARRYVISGRVQGVGYRYFTEAVAAREGIHGWVRNLPGGSVEVSAEGDADAVERFERAIRHGPPGARVDDVDVEGTVPSGRDTGFAVR